MPTNPDDPGTLWGQWKRAAAAPEVAQAIGEAYDLLSGELQSLNPTCWRSGKCCKFDFYGHRLFVTGLETAWLLGGLDEEGWRRLADAELPGMDGCPFQVDGLCSVHGLRPLGCRIYFCDPTAEPWMNRVYEQFQGMIRSIHDSRQIEYRYMEWRNCLAQAREAW